MDSKEFDIDALAGGVENLIAAYRTAQEELHALERGMSQYFNHVTGEEQNIRSTDDYNRLVSLRYYVETYMKPQLEAANAKIKELEELCEKGRLAQQSNVHLRRQVEDLEEEVRLGNIARGQLDWRTARMESDKKIIHELNQEIDALKATQQPAKRITPHDILSIRFTYADGTVFEARHPFSHPERRAEERETFTKDKDI
jgi:vacuolar-type H+-ATPase subunit I/STV1